MVESRMAGIGHNNGPTMEAGESWRRHAWGKARARLLPVLPIVPELITALSGKPS